MVSLNLKLKVKKAGYVRYADMFMKEKTYRMTLSVHYVNMVHQTLKRLSKQDFPAF